MPRKESVNWKPHDPQDRRILTEGNSMHMFIQPHSFLIFTLNTEHMDYHQVHFASIIKGNTKETQ